MAIFDYKGQDGRVLISDAWNLATYTSGVATVGALYNIPGAVLGEGNTFALPQGWREIGASELNVDSSHLDLTGSFKGENVFGSQARVFGQYNDSGQLIKMGFSIAGTNSLTDLLGYPAMIDNSYIRGYDYLLDSIKDYATGHNLTGKDVLVTGYSQGGSVTNSMYLGKDTLADGFFKDSDYFGMASPKVGNDDGIFNFGFENDIVHRLIGEQTDLGGAIIDALKGSDANYSSSTDNIVLFDTVYSLPTWPNGPFSVANLSGWSRTSKVFSSTPSSASANRRSTTTSSAIAPSSSATSTRSAEPSPGSATNRPRPPTTSAPRPSSSARAATTNCRTAATMTSSTGLPATTASGSARVPT
ncbi:hypothetical protein [Pseudomonas chlororaphis]|uniref:hypothetical protein n=1 Tax=Pseudomonas chlororaphis TaxID=587753 RepID=UPI000B0CF188|nr:hypothetical protein [Pseudomonas chlororaphis]